MNGKKELNQFTHTALPHPLVYYRSALRVIRMQVKLHVMDLVCVWVCVCLMISLLSVGLVCRRAHRCQGLKIKGYCRTAKSVGYHIGHDQHLHPHSSLIHFSNKNYQPSLTAYEGKNEMWENSTVYVLTCLIKMKLVAIVQ